MLFGDWLQEQLDKRGWSQNRLAREITAATGHKVTSSSVNQWKRNKKIPTPRSCADIAFGLNIPIQEVLAAAGYEDQSTPQIPLTDRHRLIEDMATDIRFLKERLEVSDATVRVVGRVPADSLRWAAIGDGYDVDVPRSWIAHARAPIGVEVTGDCFRSIGLWSGDIAVCDRAEGRIPHDRQIVVVRVGEDVTLKRWCVTPEGIELRDGDEAIVHTLTPTEDFEVLALFIAPLPVVPR